MADDLFTCPECHEEAPYYEVRKGIDPRTSRRGKVRVVCRDCLDKIKPKQGKR